MPENTRPYVTCSCNTMLWFWHKLRADDTLSTAWRVSTDVSLYCFITYIYYFRSVQLTTTLVNLSYNFTPFDSKVWRDLLHKNFIYFWHFDSLNTFSGLILLIFRSQQRFKRSTVQQHGRVSGTVNRYEGKIVARTVLHGSLHSKT